MRIKAVRWAQRVLLLVAGLAAVGLALVMWPTSWPTDVMVLGQRFTGRARAFEGLRVGIVAGHRGNDSGAVCPDGLQEVDVNSAVAGLLAAGLQSQGAKVDELDEFDPQLDNYNADVFVSIHADSCEVEMSGFKVASLEGGSVASELLAQCLWERYEAVTGLPRHLNSITYDMRGYHAFREIAPETPAAIIEIGFLKGDRDFLAEHQDLAAQGILAGIECFVKGGDAQ